MAFAYAKLCENRSLDLKLKQATHTNDAVTSYASSISSRRNSLLGYQQATRQLCATDVKPTLCDSSLWK
jgi:hypothetical protein